MATPTETVLEFLKALEKPGGFPDAIRAWQVANALADRHGVPVEAY